MSSKSPLVDKQRRRSNVPLSCAECIRLKLKCSRQFPCSSCVKKGCAAICPDGSLTTGKGNRFVLANTEVLHEKITTLANRVRQLEDALHDVYGQVSSERHPLLSDELLQIKRPLEREAPDETPQDPDPDTAEAIDQVGSLSINDAGEGKFYGPAANAWYLLQNEDGTEEASESPQSALPSDIPWISYTFPFSSSATLTPSSVRASLIDMLPGLPEARRLAALYFRHAAWMYTPIPENEFYNSVLTRFYESSAMVDQDPTDSHRLAIMYLVLAMGVLLDLDQQPLTAEATRYYQLGRAALALDSILEHQTIQAVQALVLMCHFMFFSHVDGSRWALMGLAVKLALTLGLHRDGNKWNLDPDEAFRRRTLFYELLTYDSWQSLTFGRPPSLSMAFIDCQIPEPITKTDQGEPEMSFSAWKHRFVSRCQSVVHEQAFGARITNYRTILDLDKKVRDFYLPPSLRVPGFGGAKMDPDAPPATLQQVLQGYCAFSMREITIFYMHRGFFASALQDHPEDPLSSKYAPSVLAAYNSACSYVGLVRSQYSQYPDLTERMWFLFTHVFSCAIVLGAIPSKSPTIPLARSALSHLDSACGLFEDVGHNPRAAKVIPVLRKLRSRAQAAMSDLQARTAAPRTGLHRVAAKADEELDALGGKTRLVSRKSPSLPSPTSSRGSYSQGGSSPSPRDPHPPELSPMHPMAPPIPEPMNQIQTSMLDMSSQWPGYMQQATGYSYQPQYADPANYWTPASDYATMHGIVGQHYLSQEPMGLDANVIQSAAYAYVDPMAGYVTTYPAGGGSPDGNMQQPDASWHNLLGQLDQA